MVKLQVKGGVFPAGTSEASLQQSDPPQPSSWNGQAGQQDKQFRVSQTCLDFELQQLSVFASQTRLCIVAAVAKRVDLVQEQLYKLAKPRSSLAEIAPTSAVRGQADCLGYNFMVVIVLLTGFQHSSLYLITSSGTCFAPATRPNICFACYVPSHPCLLARRSSQ